MEFRDIGNITITDDYNALFSNHTQKAYTDYNGIKKAEKANEYVAPAESSTAYLGAKLEGDSDNKYQDYLYALISVALDSVDVGELKIAKTVTENANQTDMFTFTTVFEIPEEYGDFVLSEKNFISDNDVTVSISKASNGKWIATVQLCHGWDVTVGGLPEGTKFSVTESNSKGYKLEQIKTSENVTVDLENKTASGGIAKDATVTVTFFNMPPLIIPDTGGVGTGMYTLAGSLLLLSALVMLFYRKRKTSLQ